MYFTNLLDLSLSSQVDKIITTSFFVNLTFKHIFLNHHIPPLASQNAYFHLTM
jgi:hypothetical protein